MFQSRTRVLPVNVSETSSSLNNLRDIALPEAPGLWPFAPGLWACIGLASLLGIALVWRVWNHWRRNRYRRAGLLLLANASTNYEVSVLLKRVALAVYPREHVAALHGDAWTTFLGFEAGAFATPETSPSAELLKQAAHWIRSHQPEGTTTC